MTWFLFVFINQAKYHAQDTGNQYSIFGRLFAYRTAIKLQKTKAEFCSIWNKCLFE